MKMFKNKNILVMGVRNKWSIAWGIAEKLKAEGANIIFSYSSERGKNSLNKVLSELDNPDDIPDCIKCDVSSDEDIINMINTLKSRYNVIDGIIHSIAHAYSEDLEKDYILTSRQGFAHALDISAYSIVPLCRYARQIMKPGGSIITLSYMGSEKVFPGYNVMGVAKAALEASVRYLANDLGQDNIRINSLSAGPIKTISARKVGNFTDILHVCEAKSPLKRNVTQEDIANTAFYLLSNLSSGVTGEVIHVDNGLNIMGI